MRVFCSKVQISCACQDHGLRANAGLEENCRVCGQTVQRVGKCQAVSELYLWLQLLLKHLNISKKFHCKVNQLLQYHIWLGRRWEFLTELEEGFLIWKDVWHKVDESHNTLCWLKVDSIKEPRSQENDSGAYLFLYLLLQSKCRSNSLVTLVVPAMRQAMRCGERQDSDSKIEKTSRKKLQGRTQKVEMSFLSVVTYLRRKRSIYELQILRCIILSGMTERHEELDWHGSAFPGPGNKLFKSLTKMACTWLMFAFDCHLGRKMSGCSLMNSPQDSCMLSSFQRADSEGCGWTLMCHCPASERLTTEDNCNTFTDQPELWGSGWSPAVYSVHPGLSQRVSGTTRKYQSWL